MARQQFLSQRDGNPLADSSISSVAADDFSVLLVDDSPVSLRGMVRLLRGQWEIDIATSSNEALYMIGRNRYSVVVTDCDMPGRDGLWLLEKTRETAPDTIRVLVSAGEPERFSSHLVSGLVHIFLSKPLSGESLQNLLIGLMMR
jgi:CheY-like chemotaxis protein